MSRETRMPWTFSGSSSVPSGNNNIPFFIPLQALRHDSGGIKVQLFLDPDASFFKGHFPQQPIMPGNIIFEAILQAARHHVSIYHQPARLAALISLYLTQPSFPGDTLLLCCDCRPNGKGYAISARCEKDGEHRARCRLVLVPEADDAA